MRTVAVVAFASCACVAQGQNLLVNASFEAPAAGAMFVNRSGDFGPGGGWGIGANIDHIGGLWSAAAGSQSVDLNGSTTGSVSQTFATTPGARYAVRYAVSENFFGDGDKTMQVKWGSDVIDDVLVIHDAARTPTNMKWAYREVRHTATVNQSTITFASTTGAMAGTVGFAAFYGPAIDDVSVIESAACVGDLNNDGLVDDTDFQIFVLAYDILDCADPAMPPQCPSDLTSDGFVDDLDFQLFAAAYDNLICE
ncbi:MAG TPA: DUF642 domain-containing protein [Phycisphaerales bacterium]